MDNEPRANSEKIGILQILLPLVVGFSKLHPGLAIGWSANLPHIQAENSTSSLGVSENDVTWMGIAGMVSTLFTGPIIDFFGPKRFLLILHLPCALFWLILAFTPYISLLYFARICLVVIVTLLGPLIAILISEISEPRIRGSILAMEEIVVAIGILVTYVMAQWIHWRLATAICAAPFFLLFICCLFVPESPYWLARKNRLEEAEKSLLRLRTSKADAAEEYRALVIRIKEVDQTSFTDQIRQLKFAQNFRPVLLLLATFALRELGGEYTIFSYSVYIFQRSGVELDAFTCTVFVGVLRVVSSTISALLLDRLGRRPILLGTTLVCALATALCGIFIIIDIQGASWVILVCLLVFVTSYGLGLGPIPWGLTGEMLPTPVRAVGGPICIFGYSLTAFFVSHFFPTLIKSIGIGYVFLLFTFFLLVLLVILFLWFPETRGKTLNELQDSFKSKTETEVSPESSTCADNQKSQ